MVVIFKISCRHLIYLKTCWRGQQCKRRQSAQLDRRSDWTRCKCFPTLAVHVLYHWPPADKLCCDRGKTQLLLLLLPSSSMRAAAQCSAFFAFCSASIRDTQRSFLSCKLSAPPVVIIIMFCISLVLLALTYSNAKLF